MVSVIVPVYNVSFELLCRCIKSIQDQSYNNIEVLIILNGCSGEYSDSVKKLITYDKVVFYETEKKGVSNARNIGIKQSKGEYIAFLDADDVLVAGYINNAVELIEKNQLDIISGGISFVYKDRTNNMRIIGNELIVISKKEIERNLLFPIEMTKESVLEDYCFSSPCSKLYRKSVINDVLFCEDISVREDLVFNLEAVSKAKSVGVVGEIWYLYYQYKDSSVRLLNENILTNNLFMISEIYRIIYDGNKDTDTVYMYFCAFMMYILETVRYFNSFKKWKTVLTKFESSEAFESFKRDRNLVRDRLNYKQKFIMYLLCNKGYLLLFLLKKIKVKNQNVHLFQGEPF